MYLCKVHGGVTSEDIIRHVKKAQEMAKVNAAIDSSMFTILFFDEANSTEAIGTIKEIMCDGRMNGEKIDLSNNLKIIAACNPYKKHSEEAIKRFESAGLGFYSDYQEKIGNLAMRELVYRVQPLPTSMLPLIWDFGQLNDTIERLYIQQIVEKQFNRNTSLNLNKNQINLIVDVLAVSQRFMRNQKNECSFVSLRDIQRVLIAIEWFINLDDELNKEIIKKTNGGGGDEFKSNVEIEQAEDDRDYETVSESDRDDSDDSDDEAKIEKNERKNSKQEEAPEMDPKRFTRCVILALNVCYHVCLQSNEARKAYRIEVTNCFKEKNINESYMLNEIDLIYEIFLDQIDLPDAIARNQALKENVFMMIICIELRIPLFIIGKPGSSKSLSKTLIAQKLQGSRKNDSILFRRLKEANLVTFQCSPLSTSEMILNTFRHCAKFQYERSDDLDRYVSVVVLDEIGLAEASTSMPLKTLHPLLEEGVYFEDAEEEELNKKLKFKNFVINQLKSNWRKVGFIGISNWVLDPAKMNRGIFVNRSIPDVNELEEIARGICKNDENVIDTIKDYLPSLANAYLNLCELAKKKREFFGLRDFYSLIKMIYYEVKEKRGILNMEFWDKTIRRNFGGLIYVNPLQPFFIEFKKNNLLIDTYKIERHHSVIDLIKDALTRKIDCKTVETENRYLLLLSQNESALDLLADYILDQFDNENKKIIFGSSFPNDQHYSQICRQIRQIKLSMELGKTVILLNLENLYESLYDALNQFYYKFGDKEKFVDLGLGTQRIKCLVHDDFRLIVIADKKYVYDVKRFPIPLVNRLEKHYLQIDAILDNKLSNTLNTLKEWCDLIVRLSTQCKDTTQKKKQFKPADVFIGFTDDTLASLILKFNKIQSNCNYGDDFGDYDAYVWPDIEQNLIQNIKLYLLQCATSDCIIRLDQTMVNDNELIEYKTEIDRLIKSYFQKQYHNSFAQFLGQLDKQPLHLIQLTTHSNLLSLSDMKEFSSHFNIRFESLLAFNTQKQFIDVVIEFLDNRNKNGLKDLLIIQCDCINFYSELVNCARYTIVDLIDQSKHRILNDSYIILILQVPKIAGGCFNGFQTTKWFCYHIDDLRDDINFGDIYNYKDKSLSQILNAINMNHKENEATTIDSVNLSRLLESIIYSICTKIVDITQFNSDNNNSNYHFLVDDKLFDENIFNNKRSIRRIEILIELFSSNNHKKFIKILLKWLIKLQLEKEMCLSNNAKAWFANEVSNLKNIMKYGTLKSSFRDYIEKSLAVLIAAIFSYIDTNSNLDLYIKSNEKSFFKWQKELWLSLFNSEQFIKLSYNNNFLQQTSATTTADSITDNTDDNCYVEKTEFSCVNINLIDFQLKLPFSWLIKDYIDELIIERKTSAEINDNENEIVLFYNELKASFLRSNLCQILARVLDRPEFLTEFYNCYFNDYLIILFNKQLLDIHHFSIIKKRIDGYINKIFQINEKSNDLAILIELHLAYQVLKHELKLLIKFIKYDNSIVRKIDEDENYTGDTNLCYLAAKLICQSIGEIKEKMNKNDWKQMFKKASNGSFLIENFMKLFEHNTSNVVEFHSLWERITIIKLFIEHVCDDNHVENADMYSYCIRLWNYLKEPIYLKTKETLEQLINFINTISRGQKMKFEKEFKTCAGCSRHSTEQFYVSSSCTGKCKLCLRCKLTLEETLRCPSCTQRYDNSGTLVLNQVANNQVEHTYMRFKTCLDRFFLDVICTLCLNDEQNLPSNIVIDEIIKQISPTPSNTVTTGRANTDLELNATVKSTLLQLLIKLTSNKAEDVLNKVFSNMSQTSDFSKLNAVYLNAIEDSYYINNSLTMHKALYSNNFDVSQLINLFKELRSIDYSNQPSNIKLLCQVARIKYVLVACSKVLIESNLINLPDALFDEAQAFFKQYPSEWPVNFLIKYIYRRYGQAKFLNIIQNNHFKWILPANFKFDEKSVGSSFFSFF